MRGFDFRTKLLPALTMTMVGVSLATASPTVPPIGKSDTLFLEVSSKAGGFGSLRLSTSSASFSELKGVMLLQASGRLPTESGSVYAGARVYRVLNADQFFDVNRGTNGFCHHPVKWLAIGQVEHPLVRNEIWVLFFEINDYREYRSTVPGLCAATAYARPN